MNAEQSGKQPTGWSLEGSTEDGTRDATKEERAGKADGDDRYRAYLLRCWQEGNSWRYSVETADKEQERRGFGSLEALLTWLETELKQ